MYAQRDATLAHIINTQFLYVKSYLLKEILLSTFYMYVRMENLHTYALMMESNVLYVRGREREGGMEKSPKTSLVGFVLRNCLTRSYVRM